MRIVSETDLSERISFKLSEQRHKLDWWILPLILQIARQQGVTVPIQIFPSSKTSLFLNINQNWKFLCEQRTKKEKEWAEYGKLIWNISNFKTWNDLELRLLIISLLYFIMNTMVGRKLKQVKAYVLYIPLQQILMDTYSVSN